MDPVLLRLEWTAQRGDALRLALRVTPRSFRRPRTWVLVALVSIYWVVLAVMDRDPAWLLFVIGSVAFLALVLFVCRFVVLRKAMKPGALWWCEYGPSTMRFNDSGPAEVSIAYANIEEVTAHSSTYEFRLRAKGGAFALPVALVSDEALALVRAGSAATPAP
ncbi:hypothetical protein ACXYTP_09175 [Tsukamurella ocularis]|uniref:hypothetical protein n=1 Tax=Tsukamurella ocularis TaxID=1970234 RepID=UPI0039EE070F